jgi:formylglycine-generating enzyme required for sulfatase activity
MANAAKRLVASEAKLTGGDRAALKPLAEALVTARLLTRGRDTLEVAHEALLRRPPIDGWLDALKDDLKLRDDVLKEAAEWASGKRSPRDLVRRGERLKRARDLAAGEVFAQELAPAGDYLAACKKQEDAAGRAATRTRAGIFVLMLGVITSLLGVIFKAEIETFQFQLMVERPYVAENITPFVLKPEAERALQPRGTFQECGPKTRCPQMTVLPPGSYLRGSPDGSGGLQGDVAEPGRGSDEGPRMEVTIKQPFAVSTYEITWDDWEACVAMRGCTTEGTQDQGYGTGKQPLINVDWFQAKAYAAWLARVTGKPYRLLTEAEWEYAARGVTSATDPHPAYPWSDNSICDHANLADFSYSKRFAGEFDSSCDDGAAVPEPSDKYPANAFGLRNMHGNVWEWVADCYAKNYNDAPTDGSTAPEAIECPRVGRGGSWYNPSQNLRSANRNGGPPGSQDGTLGFRLARTITP